MGGAAKRTRRRKNEKAELVNLRGAQIKIKR